MPKPGPKKNRHLKLVKGTWNPTRDAFENDPEHHPFQSTGPKPGGAGDPVPVRRMPADVKKIWDKYVAILWWNTEAESHLFDTWCDMTADLVKHKQGKVTRYDWTSAMFTQYRMIGAELGIGVSNQPGMPTAPAGGGSDEHFTD